MSVTVPPESRVLLRSIRWETYERLGEDLEGTSIRLTYDRGDLEIATPSHRHERWKTLAARLIWTMTEELGIPVYSGGSTTFRRADLRRGLEPDECFWIQSEARMRGRIDLDPLVDPAPDLVLEVETSRSALDRLDILAGSGVSEVWRFDGARLSIHVLEPESGYAPSSTSRCFPWLPVERFVEFLSRHAETDETTWIRRFRAWVRDAIHLP